MSRRQVLERWGVVAGKDDLTHWRCTYLIPSVRGAASFEVLDDDDDTTYCGQLFFDRTPCSTNDAVTCLECSARPVE